MFKCVLYFMICALGWGHVWQGGCTVKPHQFWMLKHFEENYYLKIFQLRNLNSE